MVVIQTIGDIKAYAHSQDALKRKKDELTEFYEHKKIIHVLSYIKDKCTCETD